MIYTLAQLRAYSRGLDSRLDDDIEYPNTWIDDKIEEGISIAQDIKPVFFTKEVYDLSQNMLDGLTTVEIILQEEPHSIQSVVLEPLYFTYKLTPNNHLLVTKRDNPVQTLDKTVTVSYFYHPTIPFTSLEMSLDMFRFVKAGIAANMYSWLSDEVNEKAYLDKAQRIAVSNTLDTDHDIMLRDPERLWKNTWV